MNACLSSLILCSPVQKRSILKIAIELVKADNRIHSKEISILDKLQKSLGLSQEELDLIHYTPLSDAVSIVRNMEDSIIGTVMEIFNSIMRIDSDIDFEENLLFAAVTMSCLPESREWSCVLSVPGIDIEVSNKQILFLEKHISEESHKVLDDKYDNLLISKAFGDIGLSLFYLPNILRDLGLSGKGPSDKFGLLKKSMSYLMPAGDMLKVDSLKDELASFDSGSFFKVVSSRFGLEPGFFPYDAFLLVKIRDSIVLDDDNAMHSTTDFFCLDISREVKHRILSFVSLFGDNTYLLPYDGYYKLLFDHFSSESKINSEICLDREFNFVLSSLDGKRIPFESSPQARTLYLLLLKYGRDGITQKQFTSAISYLETVDARRYIFNGLFDIESFESDLLSGQDDWRGVIYNTIRIYKAISTKDEQSPVFLSYISSILSHRSSLKTYINKGFSSVQELSDQEMYFVGFDRQTNAYKVGIGLSMFLVVEEDSCPIPLADSRFWKGLR